jgi:pilus assembly protein TadC
MTLSKSIALQFHDLKDKLKSAGINKKPEQYVHDALVNSLMFAFFLTILAIFLIIKFNFDIAIGAVVFVVAYIIFFFLLMKRLDIEINKRAREIDKDVLFAGRFLLVKINSGKPLINSIIDASNSYGVASKYFKEIVRDIDLGTPMEDALHNAYKNTPSKKFKKILFQINNALKIGVDVSVPLEAALDEITQDQLVEIQRYGRKLNSLTMFYMLAAIVVPSLGITLFSVVASMVSIVIDMKMFIIVLFFLIFIQLIFLSIFRSIRPNLNL